MKKPSIILMGSKPASAIALDILLRRNWDVKAVVVAARNIDLSWYGGESLEQRALRHGISVYTQADLPRDIEVDFVTSYQFRNLVKADVLAMAKRASLNFHAAPLPAYGGWAFYSVAILENCELYGVTCHHMDAHFDTGPLLSVRRFPVNIREQTATSLEALAGQEMLKLFVDVCHTAEMQTELPSIPQNKAEMRYLTKPQFDALKRIPPDADSETLDRYARAFWYPPYECASVEYNGTRIELVPAIVKDILGRALHRDDLDNLEAAVKNYRPGRIAT